ncbi:MAG: transglycosylase domain-containing protein [Erysipelotrichaceae bacterium]|nr:transglycosylase domain-containing protein [Erysipelotrichaceae bacterium]
MDDIQVNNDNIENLSETPVSTPEEDEKIKLQMKKEKQKQRYQRSVKRRKVVNALMGFVVFCVLLGALSGVSIIKVILSKTDVVLDTSDLRSHDSSLIYDDQGEQIAIVGSESRISYPYGSLPQSVVDAFVAVEDSRFFEHTGFDVPRFAKAFLENIKSLSFAQGGSTLTMQVIKNTYFAVDTIAEKGIDRKVQEIYYSLKINNIVTKEKIFELYVNKVNFGANARGIQVASQYYFGKDCTELTTVEAAMLAGIINAPNLNNPYYHLDECTKRTKEVLYQMKNHGYITEDEYAYNCSIKLENLLNGKSDKQFGTGTTVDYQAYIDVVLAECVDVYNINPYNTPVRIYTGMNKHVQEYCDELSRGNIINFPNGYANVSVVLLQNYTGLIVGLCGGRDYDGVKMFNYAYDNRVNPGSTAKGILTYPLAFEYTGLGTNYYSEDGPMTWAGSSYLITEDGGYQGDVSAQRAFTSSYNVCAVKLFRWVAETVGVETIKEYMKNIGIDASVYNGVNEQYAIGEQNFLASPIQMAAAESVILSNGLYTQPHTITRIEFINSTEEPIDAQPAQTQVLSDGAAWLTRYLQQVSVNGNSTASDWKPNGRLQEIKSSKYTVYGKTGTSLYDKRIRRKYKYPRSAAKDWLMIGGTNDYSFAFWMGFDTGQHIDETTYISSEYKKSRNDGKTARGLLEAAYEAFGAPKNANNKPSSVISISHIRGIYPYTTPPEYCDPAYIATSYILAGNGSFATYESNAEIQSINSFTATYNETSKVLNCAWAAYPDASALVIAEETKEMVYRNKTYTGARGFDRSWIDGVVTYSCDITNTETGETNYYSSGLANASYTIKNDTDHDIVYEVVGYYAYSAVGIRSNCITVRVTVPGRHPTPPDPNPDDPVDPVDPVDPGDEGDALIFDYFNF